jgi:hypothetical protein
MKHAAAIASNADCQPQDNLGKLQTHVYLINGIILPLNVTRDVGDALSIAIEAISDMETYAANTKDLGRFPIMAVAKHCLVPGGAQEDLIILLCGSHLPFILRPPHGISTGKKRSIVF